MEILVSNDITYNLEVLKKICKNFGFKINYNECFDKENEKESLNLETLKFYVKINNNWVVYGSKGN